MTTFDSRANAQLVFRPSVLPDDRRTLWYPVIIFGVLTLFGYLLKNLPLMIIPPLFAMVYPGIPLAIHSVFFISVKITLTEDKLTIVDWAGDPFVSFPRRQEISLSGIAYVYHLQKEAEAYKTETAPAAPFQNTVIRLKKYGAANSDPRRAGAVARSDNGLVLSDIAGQNKVYIMHFHDLNKEDWQLLASHFLHANADIHFLMDKKEKKGLLGKHAMSI